MSDQNEPDPDPGSSTGNGGGGAGEPGGGDAAGTGGDDLRWRALPDRFWWIPFVVGMAVLLGYGLFVSHMRGQIKAPEPDWSRLMYLFSGVEALAFAAAGFFFGREVNRGRAEAAENRADTESRRAAGAERKAANATARGQALSAALQDLADGTTTTRSMAADSHPGGDVPPPHVQAQLHQLATLANRWFPGSR